MIAAQSTPFECFGRSCRVPQASLSNDLFVALFLSHSFKKVKYNPKTYITCNRTVRINYDGNKVSKLKAKGDNRLTDPTRSHFGQAPSFPFHSLPHSPWFCAPLAERRARGMKHEGTLPPHPPAGLSTARPRRNDEHEPEHRHEQPKRWQRTRKSGGCVASPDERDAREKEKEKRTPRKEESRQKERKKAEAKKKRREEETRRRTISKHTTSRIEKSAVTRLSGWRTAQDAASLAPPSSTLRTHPPPSRHQSIDARARGDAKRDEQKQKHETHPWKTRGRSAAHDHMDTPWIPNPPPPPTHPHLAVAFAENAKGKGKEKEKGTKRRVPASRREERRTARPDGRGTQTDRCMQSGVVRLLPHQPQGIGTAPRRTPVATLSAARSLQ
ncbi:hypothetical protein B0H11DRAFT_1911195 [Mycena galericulata]|nr:hypothetical protein B0H11DRAFT_1911195 [Mycena galericulata]